MFHDKGAYGVRVVACDSSGGLVHANTKIFSGNVAPKLAEVMAIREALGWLKEKQWSWSRVEVESDCLVVVRAIRSRVLMVSHFGGVVETSHRMLRDLRTTSLYFIKRSTNKTAHYIARERESLIFF